MSESSSTKVTIVGAGLAGSLLALRLGQAGHQVTVLERRGDPRGHDVFGGRSINLALSTRGLHALQRVGLHTRVLETATAMRGRMIHAIDGGLTFQPYGTRAEDVIHSVSRGALNHVLIEAADRLDNVAFRFQRKCIDIDLARATVTVEDATGTKPEHVEGNFVVGADGAFSAVRQAFQRQDRFDFHQAYLAHGYKELTIPADAAGRHQMDPHALHIWPRRSFMMIALPNHGGSFTCTLFLAFDGQPGFAKLADDAAVAQFFREQFGDAVPLMPTLLDDFRCNPTSSLVTIRCGPWHVDERVVLLGDACHAVVPFYGQGANAAFENATILADLLAEAPGRRRDVFNRFFHARKRHADTLADLAIANFLEMRDHTGSKLFLAKKKLEKVLHRSLRGWFLPLYSMVTFSRVPYGDAVRRAGRQWRAVQAAAVICLLVLLILIAWILVRI